METYLPISYLNDFIFCPYSIYLHQVFDNSSEEVFSAKPQQRGKSFHQGIDFAQHERNEILKGIYVISNRFGVYGKIDTLYLKKQKLVESKYEIKTLYRGYFYQIWAQYFALTEMGYKVSELVFFSICNKKSISVNLPGKEEENELRQHIHKIAWYDFEQEINTNPAKCSHCIYSSLCDKTHFDHVYA